MRVTLGDGRVVECSTGITKCAPGPVPETLASEVVRPAANHGPVRRRDGSVRDPSEASTGRCGPHPTASHESAGGGGSAFAPVPAMLRVEDA